MRPPFDDSDVVAGSDEDDPARDPLDFLNTSVVQSSPTTADTSIGGYMNKEPTGLPHGLSQPPIAILPGAAESASSSPHPGPSRTAASTKPTTNRTPDTSMIGTFTSNTVGNEPAAPPPPAKKPPKPRPRPRPAYKIPGDAAQTFAALAASSSISNIPPSALPAPTADSILQEGTSGFQEKQNSVLDESIDSYSLDIAERAKMRSRGKGKAIPDNDIIELSSGSEDEFSLLPPTASKSKSSVKRKGKEKEKAVARKSPKRKKVAHDADPPGSTLATLPVPTSDAAPSSQLPPSDPPLPSSSALAPPPSPLRDPSPLSSPIPAPRKRKRAGGAILDDEDELGGSGPAGLAAAYSADLMPPPPPPFFASSSSSASHGVPPDEDLLELPAEPPKKGKKKAANEDEEDWGGEPPPKAKAKGKKKAANDEGEDWDGEPKAKSKAKGKKKAAAEDDEELDWGAKPKAKPKPRARPKKKVAEPAGEGDEAPAEPKAKKKRGKKMEVVVEVPSPGKRPPTSVNASSKDEAQLAVPPAPAIPEPDESDLSVLESDLERGGQSSKATNPSGPDTTKLSSPNKSSTGISAKGKGKGKKRVLLSDDEEEDEIAKTPPSKKAKRKDAAPSPSPESGPHPLDEEEPAKEPDRPAQSATTKENSAGQKGPSSSPHDPAPRTPAPKPPASLASASGSSRVRTVIPKNTPMSELLRKVNSMPGSPFASQRPVHSPYLKSSKSMLRRIAPLHPNRRTPPPPPPRPPPPKKTKKQLELEEKWEMELEETVEGWYCLPEEERAALRRAKRDKEMGFDD